MSVINSQPLIGASGNQSTAYNLTRSLRFRSSASAYLNRTPASAGNRKTWTWSGWVKRGTVSSQSDLFAAYIGSGTTDNQYFLLYFDAAATLRTGGYSTGYLTSTAVYRDPSAWYHIVCAVDTTQATANNRIRLYVNGAEVTSFSTRNNPTQNADLGINQAAQHQIGQNGGFGSYFDGYLAEVNFIDGQALTPSDFGETDTATGVWKPKKYTGTYGTNGFYLKFDNITSTSTLGNDSSGNSNTWTVNNISLTSGATYDSMKDVPTLTDADTANYCTLNPLNRHASNGTGVVSNGNLRFQSPSGVVISDNIGGTIAVSSGKWYFETTLTTIHSSLYLQAAVGWSFLNTSTSAVSSTHCFVDAYTTTSLQGGSDIKKNNTNVQTNLATFTSGDVIGVAFDADNLTMTFYKNNSAFGTQVTGLTAGTYMPIISVVSSDGSGNRPIVDVNFGQRPFAYTPPSGFKALNTFNLPTPTIGATTSTQANKYMDALTYSGNGVNGRTISGYSFQPGLIWNKRRSGNAATHLLVDEVRGSGTGVMRTLFSNKTDAEESVNSTTELQFGAIGAITSSGFTAVNGTYSGLELAGINASGESYVAWGWKANGTGSSNTSGTITSTVSANTSAGFSIVTYTGTGANATIGHGLGVAPKMLFVKSRSNAFEWKVWHTSLSSGNQLKLNNTDAQSSDSTVFTTTTPSSTVFSVGTNAGTNQSAATYVAYCFAEVAGYSQIGSYTGNGSTDGPFIYLGFRPKFVLFKRINAAANWMISDSSRSPNNVSAAALFPNSTQVEYTASGDVGLDFVSNGIKIRNTGGETNVSGGIYIYAAFAENPFKYSLAR